LKTKILIIILISLSTTGFLPVKQSIYAGKEGTFSINKNQTLTQKIHIEDNVKINGIILLVSLKDKTELILKIKDLADNIIMQMKTDCQPENTLRQTLKIFFTKPVVLPRDSILELSSQQNYEIIHSVTSNISDNQNFFYIDNQPVNGSIFLELIKPLSFSQITARFINKFSRNSFFVYFYTLILFAFSSFTIYQFCKKEKKECRC